MRLFISYTSPDSSWAEWVSWQLRDAGYDVVLQAWSFRPGHDFAAEMQRAMSGADRTVVILTPSYESARFTVPEWAAAFKQDPAGVDRKLVPVRVAEFEPSGVFSTRIYIDLVGIPEDEARRRLLAGLGDDGVPTSAPPYPGPISGGSDRTSPRYPTTLPPVWSVPFQRNPNFTGRDATLEQMHTYLQGRVSAVPATPATLALTGVGGIGKSQLAVEYAYRYHASYDAVWWVRSTDDNTRRVDLAVLRDRLFGGGDTDSLRVASAMAGAGRVLLIFDDTSSYSALGEDLPTVGSISVIVTSQSSDWTSIARVFAVPPFDDDTATQFLLGRARARGHADATELARVLGGLPLALDQAGSLIAQAGISIADYLALFRERPGDLLSRGRLPWHESAAETVQLAIDRASGRSQVAYDILQRMALLAPSPYPIQALLQDLTQDSGGLYDLLTVTDALAVCRDYSLVNADGSAVSVHQVIARLIADQVSGEALSTLNRQLVRVLSRYWPSNLGEDHTNLPLARSLFPHAMTLIERTFQLGEVDEYTVHLAFLVGAYLVETREFAQAMDIAGKLVDALSALGDESSLAVRAYSDAARLYYRVREFASAVDLLRRALALVERFDRGGLLHGDVLLGLTLVYGGSRASQHEEAVEYAEEALAILEHVTGPTSAHTAEAVHALGALLEKQGRLEEARAHLERALTIAESTRGRLSKEAAHHNRHLAQVLMQMGRHDDARVRLLSALAADTNVFGRSSKPVAVDMSYLADALIELGDVDAAIDLIDQVIEIERLIYGDNHPYIAIGIANYAHRLLSVDRPDVAKRLARDAAAILFRSADPSEDFCRATYETGSLALLLHERSLSIRVLLHGVEVVEPRAPATLSLADMYCLLARAHEESEDIRSAVKNAARALDIAVETTGGDSERTIAEAQHVAWLRNALSAKSDGGNGEDRRPPTE